MTRSAQGNPMDACDTLVAGHARSRGLAVITGDLRHFTRFAGLRAEDCLAA